MKKFIAAIAVVMASALMFNLGVAGAKPVSKTTQGKTVSFANGKLRVKNKQGTVAYVVGRKTECGYSRGMTGNQMPCTRLRKKQFLNKRVTVIWRAANGRRVAELVSVHL